LSSRALAAVLLLFGSPLLWPFEVALKALVVAPL